MGTGLVVVLGYTNCGAINAVISGHVYGYIKYIANDILKAVGSEKEAYKVCCKNVKHSCVIIESSLVIQKDEKEYRLSFVGAVYHLEDGRVGFI